MKEGGRSITRDVGSTVQREVLTTLGSITRATNAPVEPGMMHQLVRFAEVRSAATQVGNDKK